MISAADRTRLPQDATDAYPLAQVQLGMLVEMLGDDRQRRYINASTFVIRDGRPLQIEALQRAAETVVARHEMLRTSIHLDEYAEPLQVVHERADVRVKVADVRGRDEEEAVREWLSTERSTPFDLSAPPLLRIGALITDGDSWRLAFTHCHAITEAGASTTCSWRCSSCTGPAVTGNRNRSGNRQSRGMPSSLRRNANL